MGQPAPDEREGRPSRAQDARIPPEDAQFRDAVPDTGQRGWLASPCVTIPALLPRSEDNRAVAVGLRVYGTRPSRLLRNAQVAKTLPYAAKTRRRWISEVVAALVGEV